MSIPPGSDRPSFLGTKGPASIRYNNPGAMWPGPSSRKFGAIGGRALNDGLGQGNQIAIFDDAIDGAAALFDLWDRVYSSLKLRDAIIKWSGADLNHKDPKMRALHAKRLQSYLDVFWDKAQTPPDMIIDRDKLRHPEFGIRFAAAMAWHETGKEFPLTDDQWREAQRQAFVMEIAPPVPSKVSVKQVLKTSSKHKAASFWKWLFGGAGTSVGVAEITDSWQMVKSSMGVGSEIIATIQSFGILTLAGVGIVLAIVFNWFQLRQADDIREGRYIPSGAEE